MKNHFNFPKITLVFLAASGLIFSTAVLAQEPFFIEGEVSVSKTCQVTDTGGVLHSFPKEESPDGLLGICAIVAAKQAGIIQEFEFIDFGFGLFLDSINGVKTSPDWDLSWSIYHNNEFAQVGLTDLVMKKGDTLSFIYTSFSSGQEFDKLVLRISTSQVSSSGGSEAKGSGSVAVHNFSAEKAIQFLSANQLADGSFGEPIFTDWAAIAFGAYDSQHPAALSLKNYLLQNTDPGTSLGSPVLSFIRRAMALMSLGINPYSGTKTNYIQKITEHFDGEQIGYPNFVNDDIFALLVLRKAGFSSSDNIIQKITQFILDQQKSDGSWTGGVDMASAAIQALTLVSDIEGVSRSLQEARNYLQKQQQADGGFGNPDSTSWAIQAIAALSENQQDWKKNESAPLGYLFYFQRQDGSVLSSTPIWSTAYAIPAALSKPWGEILQSFDREQTPDGLLLSSIGQVKGEFIDATEVFGAESVSQIISELRDILQELEIIKGRLAIFIDPKEF